MDDINTPEELRGKIKKIFFGEIPMLFAVVKQEHFVSLREVITKQKVTSVYELNYVQLIQDVGELLTPTIKELIQNIDLGEADLLKLKSDNRILISSLYLEVLQNKNCSTNVKLEMGFFCKTFIQTLTNIYSVEILQDQSGFIELINQHEKELEEIQIENERILNAIYESIGEEIQQLKAQVRQKMASEDSNVLFFWKFGEDKLTALENRLKSIPLVEMDSTLVPLFSTQPISSFKKVDWKGKQAALIYMFYRITDGTMLIAHSSVYKFMENRFTINGVDVTAKQLSSSMSNIIGRYINKAKGEPKPAFLKEIEGILALIGL